jgi:hypothetical protein
MPTASVCVGVLEDLDGAAMLRRRDRTLENRVLRVNQVPVQPLEQVGPDRGVFRPLGDIVLLPRVLGQVEQFDVWMIGHGLVGGHFGVGRRSPELNGRR